MDVYLDAIADHNPRCVYGYASSLALLAAHAQERGRRLRLPQLQVVCTTGEPLYPHQRALIGEVFGVPMANEYGCRDVGFVAHETPQGQLLQTSECIVLEVLDEAGQPVAPGELGEAVMTGLCSEAQPFIRYRTGDMVRMGTEPDREGRGLRVVDEVVGRSTDFLVRADGTVMHALAGIYVLRATPGVAEFKLIQHTLHDLEVLVVTGPGWSDAGAKAIEAGLQGRLGEDMRVRVCKVDQIAPEASGKHRYVVSRVALAGQLGRATAQAAP
jgi:phenylacetate-CoA ligase